MRPDLFGDLSAWIEEASAATDASAGDAAARLKDALADAADKLEERLDALGSRLDGPSLGGVARSHSSSHSESDGGEGASSSTAATAVAGPIPAQAARSIKVGVTVKATPGEGGDVKFDLVTEAETGGSGANGVSVSGDVRASASRPDKLNVKVAVGDWAKDLGDGDSLDFLVCVLGARKGATDLRDMTRKEAKDVDLVLDLNLKGAPLKAKVKLDGLTTVACEGADGKPGVGYLGKADDEGRTIKVVLSPAKGGAPVAVLALDIQAEAAARPDIPIVPDLFL